MLKTIITLAIALTAPAIATHASASDVADDLMISAYNKCGEIVLNAQLDPSAVKATAECSMTELGLAISHVKLNCEG